MLVLFSNTGPIDRKSIAGVEQRPLAGQCMTIDAPIATEEATHEDRPTRPHNAPQAILAWADRWRWWLLATVLISYLAAFNGQFRLSGDAATYVNVAQAMNNSSSFAGHGQRPHFYPGLPYLLSYTFQLFGTDSLVPPHLLVLTMALASLGMVYWLLYLHAGRAAAVLVTCMVGINASIHEHAYRLLSDLPFLLGVLIFLVGYEGARLEPNRPNVRNADDKIKSRVELIWLYVLLMIVGLGLAVSMRRAMWVLVGAVVLTIFWFFFNRHQGARRGSLILLAGGALLMVLLFSLVDPRQRSHSDFWLAKTRYSLPTMVSGILTQSVPKLLEETVVETAFASEVGAGLDSVLAILLIGSAIFLVRRRVLWGLLVMLWVIASLLHVPLARYLLPIIPLLAYGWWLIAQWISSRLKPPWDRMLCVAMVLLWLLPNTIGVVDMVFEQRHVPFLQNYKQGKYVYLKELGRQLAQLADDRLLILSDDPSELRYYCGHAVLGARWLRNWNQQGRMEARKQIRLAHKNSALYVVQPMSENLSKWMKKLRLKLPGNPLFVIDRAPGQLPLTVYRAIRQPKPPVHTGETAD